MSSSLVWIQLYYQGKDEPVGNPIPIEKSEIPHGIIAGLTKAVKKELELDARLNQIFVYPPKSSGDREKQYGPDKEMKEVIAELETKKTSPTSGKYPLIVVALAQQQKPANATPPPHQTQERSKEDQMVYDYVKEEMDNRTKHKAMSEASVPFAEAILKGYGLRVVVDPPVKEPGSKTDPPAYSWKVVDNSAYVWKKGEHAGTPGARDWAQAHLLAGEREYGLKVVTGALLPAVKANRRSSSGKGDIAIGKLEDMNYGEVYLFANGLIELKTDEYPLKTGQNLLQLLSLSTVSSFGKGVALLATDCNTKWETFHFSEKYVVRRRIYKHGQKAWEDFMELIRSPEARVYPELAAIEENGKAEEDDQNLDGFDLPDQDGKRLKALEDHAMLEQLADHLGVIYGERPLVPPWARAEARIPGYYV